MTNCCVRNVIRLHTGSTGPLLLSEVTGGGGVGWVSNCDFSSVILVAYA